MAEEEKVVEEEKKEEVKRDTVTPFNIDAADTGVDYEALIQTFGCSRFTNDHIERIAAITGRAPHHFLRRMIYFAHRDLDHILTLAETKKPWYLYTGRGPSSVALHLGHMVPFIMCKWLYDAFDVPIVIQMTDDEKYLYRPELSLDDTKKYTRENVKDIIACGFDVNKTFIFSDTQYIGKLYENFIIT